MEGTKGTGFAKGITILRVALGGGFLFAGLDKALDFAGSGKAFDATGFLKGATGGAWLASDPKTVINPTHDFWVSLAGNAGLMQIVNTLVVTGEIAIGAALVLGLATRFAGLAGTLMMGLFFVANWSFANGPFNEQFMYGVAALTLAITGAGQYYSLDAVLARTESIRRVPALQFLLG